MELEYFSSFIFVFPVESSGIFVRQIDKEQTIMKCCLFRYGLSGVLSVPLIFAYLGRHQIKRISKEKVNRNSIKEAMNLLPTGICYFNSDGTVKLANTQIYQLLGFLRIKICKNSVSYEMHFIQVYKTV